MLVSVLSVSMQVILPTIPKYAGVVSVLWNRVVSVRSAVIVLLRAVCPVICSFFFNHSCVKSTGRLIQVCDSFVTNSVSQVSSDGFVTVLVRSAVSVSVWSVVITLSLTVSVRSAVKVLSGAVLLMSVIAVLSGAIFVSSVVSLLSGAVLVRPVVTVLLGAVSVRWMVTVWSWAVSVRSSVTVLSYLLTNWLAYLYGRIQSPRPDVMPDRRGGHYEGRGLCIRLYRYASQLVRSLFPD